MASSISPSSGFNIVGNPVVYYGDYETTNLPVELVFGAAINTLKVANDSTTDTMTLSWDGATVIIDLYAGESITINTAGKTSVYARCNTNDGDHVRVWGY